MVTQANSSSNGNIVRPAWAEQWISESNASRQKQNTPNTSSDSTYIEGDTQSRRNLSPWMEQGVNNSQQRNSTVSAASQNVDAISGGTGGAMKEIVVNVAFSKDVNDLQFYVSQVINLHGQKARNVFQDSQIIDHRQAAAIELDSINAGNKIANLVLSLANEETPLSRFLGGPTIMGGAQSWISSLRKDSDKPFNSSGIPANAPAEVKNAVSGARTNGEAIQGLIQLTKSKKDVKAYTSLDETPSVFLRLFSEQITKQFKNIGDLAKAKKESSEALDKKLIFKQPFEQT